MITPPIYPSTKLSVTSEIIHFNNHQSKILYLVKQIEFSSQELTNNQIIKLDIYCIIPFKQKLPEKDLLVEICCPLSQTFSTPVPEKLARMGL